MTPTSSSGQQTAEGASTSGTGASSVAGIDLAAGRGVTAVAVLRVPSAGWPLTLAGLSFPESDDDIIAEITRSGADIVAMDAPLTLPAPVAAALAGRPPTPGASPYTRAAERDAAWGNLGVRPLPVSFLGGLTLRAIPLAARIRSGVGSHGAPVCVIEAFPTAALAALSMRPRSAAGPRRGKTSHKTSHETSHKTSHKTSPERRQATQQSLAALIAGLPLPSPSEHLRTAQALDVRDVPGTVALSADALSADALDALAAALTAAAHLLGASAAIGDVEEGCIMLPDARRLASLWPPLLSASGRSSRADMEAR